MQKLSKNQSSKKILDSISDTKSKPISKKDENKLEEASLVVNEEIRFNNSVYNQSNSHSNEAIISAERFIDNIAKMRNPHIRDCVSLSEKYGTIEDYSENQEQRDLEKYKRFINSSAYDDIKEIESGIEKKLTLTKLRKISGMHDD